MSYIVVLLLFLVHCTGELCVMFRQDILPYARRLLPIIIGHILDTSSVKKQEIAVKTLGNVSWVHCMYMCSTIGI
jgi:hypothetical protein